MGLSHREVIELILGGGTKVMLSATELAKTSIKRGGRKRVLSASKQVKRSYLSGEEEEEQFLLTPPLVLKRATNRRKLNPSGNGLDVEQAIHSPWKWCSTDKLTEANGVVAGDEDAATCFA